MGTKGQVNSAPLTEEVWLSWRRVCFAAMIWRHVVPCRRPDCLSYLLTTLPLAWRYWDKDKSSWDNFAFTCAKRRIIDYFKIESKVVNLTRKGPTRAVAIDDLTPTELDTSFVHRRSKEPVTILANSELLKILWDNLSPSQKNEFVWWYKGEPSHNKKQDNKRTIIKQKARMLFGESLPEMFSGSERRIQQAYLPQTRYPGCLGENAMSERWRILASGGVLRKAAKPRRKRQKK